MAGEDGNGLAGDQARDLTLPSGKTSTWKTKMLSIGAFSRLSGLSIKALRLYDSNRLFRPAAVDRKTGYRRYDLTQIVEAHRILALRQMGMSLAVVQRKQDGPGDLLVIKRAIEIQMESLAVQLATVNEALSEHGMGRTPPSVVLKRVPATAVVSRRTNVADYAEADALIEELCDPESSAVSGAVWHDCGTFSGRVDAELFLLTSDSLSPQRRPKGTRGELPPMLAASCIHGPGDAAATLAYQVMQSWLDRSGYRRAGPYRELYYRINGRPRLTEVQLPITRPVSP